MILRTTLLGVLQALTEFFPFSNSAHRILIERLFNFHEINAAYEVIFEAGLLSAICIYYMRDVVLMIRQSPALLKILWSRHKPAVFQEFPYALTLSLILVSCIATFISGAIFQDAGETLSRHLEGLGALWLIMGFFLWVTKRFKAGWRTAYEMNHQDAFVIGLAQGLTVFPGFSRIGLTLFFALLLGMERKEAARYSFLLGIPYLLFHMFSKGIGKAFFYQADQSALLVSFIATLCVGLLALAASLRLLESGKYYRCSLYCVLVGSFALVLSQLPNLNF